MVVDLKDVPVGTRCTVVSVEGETVTAQRVRELGVTPGSTLTIIRKAPFGGPIDIALEYGRIGLRTGDDVEIMVSA